jgi:hypothetical protein
MNKKDFKILQHNLIPLALITGNVALAHFIYLLTNAHYSYTLILTSFALLTLVVSILRPNKYLLSMAIILYIAFLSFILIGT